MDTDRKRRLFDVLVNRVGLKEVEVGFPAAAEAEFEFMRILATEELIPSDVTVMVLTQARAGRTPARPGHPLRTRPRASPRLSPTTRWKSVRP
jgi:2-isopropylmalate synthase